MRDLTCLIVDDEELARSLVEKFVERIDGLEVTGTAKNPVEANKILQEQAVDILFLDIQMPEISGTQFLKLLSDKPQVILTTAYPEYALEGFELDVTDYLLKPFSFERFNKAVQKAMEIIRLKEGSAKEPPSEEKEVKEYMIIKSDHKLHKLYYKDIIYIEGLKEYVSFYTDDKRLIGLYSLIGLEKTLPADQFIRIHRSYIVAKSRVTTLEGSSVHLGDKQLPIGNSYKDKVLKEIF